MLQILGYTTLRFLEHDSWGMLGASWGTGLHPSVQVSWGLGSPSWFLYLFIPHSLYIDISWYIYINVENMMCICIQCIDIIYLIYIYNIMYIDMYIYMIVHLSKSSKPHCCSKTLRPPHLSETIPERGQTNSWGMSRSQATNVGRWKSRKLEYISDVNDNN